MTMTSQETGAFPTWFFVLVAITIVTSWVHYAFIMRRRKHDMTAMALRLGLQRWPDDSTPRDLSLRGTPFEHWSKLFNVYEGLLNHRQVAVLDFRKQAGKSSWSRTIVAVRAKENLFAGKPFDLESREVGDWQLCYFPVGFLDRGKLMDVSEIEELLKGIARSKVQESPKTT